VPLRPKTLALLRYLLNHAGQMVTKAELLDALWPQTYGRELLLKRRIYELRHALGDNPHAPRFIETVGRRGYRFLAPLHPALPVTSAQWSVTSEGRGKSSPLATRHWPLVTAFVGREAELARLHQLYAKAAQGQRQMVFVTGEAGIGKTALIETFLEQVQSSKPVLSVIEGSKVPSLQLATNNWPLATVLVGRGQCVEHYGAGEAYLPMLEALGRLCRQAGGGRILEVLRRP